MREYCYKDIQEITNKGILFKDGFRLSFEECHNEWAIENNLKKSESHCVAKRSISEKPPFFLFYSKDRVKVVFDKKCFWRKRKNEAEFQNLQIMLNRVGVTSYDMT